MTDQPQLLPTRPIEVELANQFKIAFDLGAKNLALQETVTRLTKERDALLAYAMEEEVLSLPWDGCLHWDMDCNCETEAASRAEEQRRAALALCKEST